MENIDKDLIFSKDNPDEKKAEDEAKSRATTRNVRIVGNSGGL